MPVNQETPTSRTRSSRMAPVDILRVLVVLALVGLVVALAVDNRQEVSVGWLVDEGATPLYQVLLAAFAAGIVVGLVARRRHRHH